MFRTAYSKLPALLLALIACLVTVYQPVFVIAAAAQSDESKSEKESESKSKSKSESESETESPLETKEFAQRTFSSRRLRHKQNQLLIESPMAMDHLRELPVLSDFNPSPQALRLSSPSALRAPPA